jgi:hypothetical protein
MAGGKKGRPSKGDRSFMYTRVPNEVAQAIRDQATRRGIAYGDVIAEMLCAAHGVDYAPTKTNRDQEALELKTA